MTVKVAIIEPSRESDLRSLIQSSHRERGDKFLKKESESTGCQDPVDESALRSASSFEAEESKINFEIAVPKSSVESRPFWLKSVICSPDDT